MLRGYVAELGRLGILDQARAQASPEVLPLLEKPERAPSWIGSEAIDEMLLVVGALRGRETAREIGYHMAKDHGFAAALAPVIHVALSIMGGDPGALFSRLPIMTSLSTKGLEVSWVATAPSSGTVRIRASDPTPDLAWAAWEGIFVYGLELASAEGTVARARTAPDGKSCEVDVSWEPRKR